MNRLGELTVAALVWIAALLVLVVTVLPMWDTNLWWIRVMDFPRLQIAVVGGVVMLAALFLPGRGSRIVPLLMIAACGYQFWRIYPYTPLATVEMSLAAEHPHSVRLLAANVLMENRRHDVLLGVIASYDPDVLLLMETDQTWIDALAPALDRYPTVIREPRNNHYGMVFATRLAVDDARAVYLTASDTPTIFAQMTGPGGTTFRFVGLHPRPPAPDQSTEQRDAQIYYAARFARTSGVPLIAMGDFNDVAWSDTSRLFKHVGQYLDPRIGRGFYASFDAEKFYLRFPIDQLFMTEDVAVVSIARQPYVGSDHFPMSATLRLDADLAARLNVRAQPLSDEEQEEVAAAIAQGRKRFGSLGLATD